MRAAEARAAEATERAASWQRTVEDSQKVHAAELARAKEQANAAAAAVEQAERRRLREAADWRRRVEALEASNEQLKGNSQQSLQDERNRLERRTLEEVGRWLARPRVAVGSTHLVNSECTHIPLMLRYIYRYMYVHGDLKVAGG